MAAHEFGEPGSARQRRICQSGHFAPAPTGGSKRRWPLPAVETSIIIQEVSGRWLLVVRALHAILLSSLVLCGLVLAFHGGQDQVVVLNAVIVFGAALLCVLRAVRISRQRLAWLALGLGLASSASADLVWSVWIQRLDPEPFVSVADPLWLMFYPLAYVTLVVLLRSSVVRFHPSVWLDGVIGGLGAATIGAALAFQTILDSTGGKAAVIAVNLTYPLGDLLLLVLVVGVLALLGWRPDRTWWLLAAAMMVYAVADTLYLFQVAAGTYRGGTWLEALWPAAAVLFGLAAWSPSSRERPLRLEGWVVLVMPTLFAVSSLAVLVLDHFFAVSTLAVLLATGCVLAAVARTAVTFREVRALADTRRQAHTDDLTGLGNRAPAVPGTGGGLDRPSP
jgi:hypothetical protein